MQKLLFIRAEIGNGIQRYLIQNDRQKGSQLRAVVQNQKGDNQKYRGADRNHSQRVINSQNQKSEKQINKRD